MTRLTVVFAGRVAICAAVIVFSATGVPWTPVDVAFAFLLLAAGAVVMVVWARSGLASAERAG